MEMMVKYDDFANQNYTYESNNGTETRLSLAVYANAVNIEGERIKIFNMWALDAKMPGNFTKKNAYVIELEDKCYSVSYPNNAPLEVNDGDYYLTPNYVIVPDTNSKLFNEASNAYGQRMLTLFNKTMLANMRKG